MNPSESRKTRLYNDLKRRILTLELAPGSDMDEVALSREYEISRTPLWDVFRILAGDMEKITGAPFSVSGLCTPGTVLIQPAAYVRRMAESLADFAAIHENSPVIRFSLQGAGWTVEAARGSGSTDRIILANNGLAESFGFFRRRLLHVFTYASMIEPIPRGALGGESDWGASPADPMGTTLRRFESPTGSRLIVRSRSTCNLGMEAGSRTLDNAAALHRKKFRSRFPGLRTLPMAWSWAGQLCLSSNGMPAHGEVAPGVFSAVCQNGLGTAKGTLSGMSAAELALGRKSELATAMTSYDEPRKLPPSPITWLGANGLMRWKEWRAGDE